MNKYKDYNDKVQKWMQNIEKDLQTEIGTIPDSYQLQLDLLADALQTYITAKKEIDTYGVLIKGRKDELVKNPAIAVLNSSQLFIAKLLNTFILTRSSKSKLGSVTDVADDEPISEYM